MATAGTTGDLQPFLALGVELRRRGHEALLAGPPSFARRTESLGFGFVGLGPPIEAEELRAAFAPAYERREATDQIALTLPFAMRHAEESVRQLEEKARNADVLLSFPYQPAGQVAAELLGLPFVSVHFSPFGSSRRPKIAAIAAPPFNALRATFGLGSLADPLGTDGVSSRLALTAVSPTIFPRPARWPAHHHVTGFWFLDEAPPVAPELVRFVEDGEPPVVIGFGSMMHRDPARITRTLVEAVEGLGVRAVIQAGWSGLDGGAQAPSSRVLFAPFVPHGWLFPRASCVVHAGGAGTTAAALRAGVPMVLIPHWLDQHLWGALVLERGLASASLPLADLTADSLERAIREAASSRRIRRKCLEASVALEREAGTARAADRIEELVGVAPRDSSPSPL
jgi:sterol 3beta-glucosyltransferase